MILNRKFLRAALLASSVSLSACGITYVSSSVVEQGAGSSVVVLPLNAHNVVVANSVAYLPRSLPEVFYQTAQGGNLRGAGVLPEMPYFPAQGPIPLELRLPPTVDAEPYRLGVGDVVLLATRAPSSIAQELDGLLAAQNRRQGYTIRDDGTISIPDIGQVRLDGMTIEEAEAAVFRRLLESQVDPAFSLEVAEFNSKRVSIGGAVTRATLLPVTLNRLDLGEAIIAAGGLAIPNPEFASIRLYRDGNLYQIPIETFMQRPELQNLALSAGDAIYVDTSYDLDRAFAFYQQQISAIGLQRGERTSALAELQAEIGLRRATLDEQRNLFTSRQGLDAEPRDYVYLTGEVTNQSRIALPYGRQVSLADVLFESGGYNVLTGNPAQIYVLRATDAAAPGNVTAWHLNARNVGNMILATQMEMRPNDVIFIGAQPITKWNRTLQQALPQLISVAARSAG